MEQWVLLRKGADFEKIGKQFGISPRLACLVRNREVIGDEQIEKYLNGTLSDLYDGLLMKDMDKAVDILREKISEHKKIRIIGDYDIDGVNATYILLEALERIGADVDSDIPHRIEDGYGLNIELIERAYRDQVDTIITCDNGIAAYDAISYGKELGMTIIVTDHHEVPYEEEEEKKQYILPPADAVIDPKREDCEYPFKGLCGAAVAYKLAEAIYEVSGEDVFDIDDLIENVAIATVGDVMDLVDENRIFVKEGLQMIHRTRNLGLCSLIECTGIEKTAIEAYHIGFVLGPCLNASGRLDSAKRALELLRAKDKKHADILAGDLKALNDSRKELTVLAVEQAIRQVEESDIKNDRVLVVYLPECHESLAGIVAGKVREKYYKPAFVLTDAENGVKGSGRSIEGYHMYEELNKVKRILTKYGGHTLAAGVSMERENVGNFRKMLNIQCALTEKDLTEKVVIDMELPFQCVTESFVHELEILEPFGKGNTKPVFAGRNIELISGRILGKNKNVLKMQVKDAYQMSMDAMYFGNIEDFLGYLDKKFGKGTADAFLTGRSSGLTLSMTYYPAVNEYMGRKNMQIVVTHYQ